MKKGLQTAVFLINIGLWGFAVNLLSSETLQAQTIYVWEDEQGVMHFSDQNNANNQTLILKEQIKDNQLANPISKQLTTQANHELSEKTTHPTNQLIIEQHPAERSVSTIKNNAFPLTVEILLPDNFATIRNNDGNLIVKAALSRQLSQTEGLQLWLDGKPYQHKTTNPLWLLSNIPRGTHRLEVLIYEHDQIIQRSKITEIYLHRAFIKQRRPEPRR